MEKLINEFSVGLFFWQSVLFIALIFLLRKFAWKPILNSVNEREEKIEGSLKAAEEAQKKIQDLNNESEILIAKAREERDVVLKEARDTRDTIVADAKNKAKEEADKVMESAREEIQNEKQMAIIDLKNQVASLSIEVAEKIIRTELASDDKQKQLATNLAEEVTA